MLRLARDAPVVSLIRYGPVVVGSGTCEQSLHSLEVCVLNVPARKILSVGRSAGLPVLHATAGVLSEHNPYLQQCASLTDLSLRAEGSSINFIGLPDGGLVFLPRFLFPLPSTSGQDISPAASGRGHGGVLVLQCAESQAQSLRRAAAPQY